MNEPEFEQYDEENWEHQCPIYAISQWQEWNECDGTLSIMMEEMEAKYNEEDKKAA